MFLFYVFSEVLRHDRYYNAEKFIVIFKDVI